MPTLESRLARLESTVRLQRFALVAVLAISGAAMLMGADDREKVTKVETLEARRIMVIDARGNPQATLGENGAGEIALQLFDKRGDARAVLTAGNEHGGAVLIFDQVDGKRRVKWARPLVCASCFLE